jgi:hypothetical protein
MSIATVDLHFLRQWASRLCSTVFVLENLCSRKRILSFLSPWLLSIPMSYANSTAMLQYRDFASKVQWLSGFKLRCGSFLEAVLPS